MWATITTVYTLEENRHGNRDLSDMYSTAIQNKSVKSHETSIAMYIMYKIV